MYRENQQLKEQMVNLYQEFKLNNVNTATQYQMINMQNEIHIREVSKLKKHIEYLEQQLKRKDEAFVKAINKLKHAIDHLDKIDMLHPFENELLEILQKYKGDNK